MKYIKMLGLAAVAAAALMAFVGAGTASATTLVGSGGTVPTGTTINAQLKAGTEAILEAGFGTINCDASTVDGKTGNQSGTLITGNVDVLTFTECTGDTVSVLKKGSLSIHHIAGTTNGTVTSSGAEVTVINHDTGGTHCIYRTENTVIGTLTGNTKGNATLHADATLIRVPTSAFCASEATWKATYEVTTPSPLWVES